MNKWSFKKPEEAGLYLCNYGDVVTDNNIFTVKIRNGSNGALLDQDGIEISSAPPAIKSFLWSS